MSPSAGTRRTIYLVVVLAGVVVGSLQAAYAVLGPDQPTWVRVVVAVYAYVAGASGIMAALNTADTYADGGGYVARHTPDLDRRGGDDGDDLAFDRPAGWS